MTDKMEETTSPISSIIIQRVIGIFTIQDEVPYEKTILPISLELENFHST